MAPAAGRSLGRSQDDVRRHNLSALLRSVHDHGPTPRVRLTDVLGLNRSTVGDLVGQLTAAGLLAEERPGPDRPEPATSRVGRPSLVVRPQEESACVLAVYVDVHWLRVARVGLGGRVLARRTEHLATGVGPDAAVARVADLAAALLATPAERAALVGVGVAVPGTVRAGTGVVGLAPNLGWREVPLRDRLDAVLPGILGRPVPVAVANDADLGVLAEHRRGAARGADDVVYLCGTWGLGGGILTGGHPLTGSQGYGGEVGHVGVDPAGRSCHCGSRGCWEAEAMADAWGGPLDLDADAPDVAARVLARLARGDVAARRTRDRLSRSFARGLAGVVNVVDPEVVLLGAGLWRELWPVLADDVLPWLRRLVLPALAGSVQVLPAGLGEDSTLVGAAELAFEPLLADPLAAVALPVG